MILNLNTGNNSGKVTYCSMLVYNKYLKELGLKKNDFPFDCTEKEDHRYALDKKAGTIESQTWNLDRTIVLELYTYLRDFQDNYMKMGVPAPYFTYGNGEKRWHQVVADIIDGLKAYIEARELRYDNFKDWDKYKAAEQACFDRFDKAWKLLGDNIHCFWW